MWKFVYVFLTSARSFQKLSGWIENDRFKVVSAYLRHLLRFCCKLKWRDVKYRWYMNVLQLFSKWVRITICFCRVLQNLFETFKSVQECFRIDSFIGELHNENLVCQNYTIALLGLHQGLFIGFHKCFFSIAGDRDCRIDKVEERVAIKLT